MKITKKKAITASVIILSAVVLIGIALYILLVKNADQYNNQQLEIYPLTISQEKISPGVYCLNGDTNDCRLVVTDEAIYADGSSESWESFFKDIAPDSDAAAATASYLEKYSAPNQYIVLDNHYSELAEKAEDEQKSFSIYNKLFGSTYVGEVDDSDTKYIATSWKMSEGENPQAVRSMESICTFNVNENNVLCIGDRKFILSENS